MREAMRDEGGKRDEGVKGFVQLEVDSVWKKKKGVAQDRLERSPGMVTLLQSVITATENGEVVEPDTEPLGSRNGVWNSDDSTVIAMAADKGHELIQFKSFVGTLRLAGFRGHIILGVDPCLDPKIRHYLDRNGVLVKTIGGAMDCPYIGGAVKQGQCSALFPDLSLDVARFAYLADWLTACEECRSGVLMADFSDVYFQADPFLKTPAYDLALFAEHPGVTTDTFLTQNTFEHCYGFEKQKFPAMSGGLLMGSKPGVIRGLRAVVEEYQRLYQLDLPSQECYRDINDAALLNALFYSGRLVASAVPYRRGPVATAKYSGIQTLQSVDKTLLDQRKPGRYDLWRPTTGDTLAVPEVQLTGDISDWQRHQMAGLPKALTQSGWQFVQEHYDSIAAVVYQADRFGGPIKQWLEQRAEAAGATTFPGEHAAFAQASSDETSCSAGSGSARRVAAEDARR